MRSLRAIQRFCFYTRPTLTVFPVAESLIRKHYCSSCETKPVPNSGNAGVTQNVPVPPADHRQLGVEQELFTTSIYSPGSPLFLPHGSRIFNKLIQYLRAQYEHFGFQEVISPTIYKKSLWEKSGHWENYAEDMFAVTGRGAASEAADRQIGEDEEFGLKPMNCPGHCILFASKPRSFRELPIRYADFSPLHRNEISGALSGLTRVRRFHQDDGHIFCQPTQVGEEISKTLDFVRLTYDTFKLGPYRLALSTRPKDHYIGTEDDWNTAENALRQSLDASGQVWSVNEGDGAFYGPKIDIILKDSDGKEHQTATIQLDFQLPKRFDLIYSASPQELAGKGPATLDGRSSEQPESARPVMIHRAILGSVERFLALLIEHYAGRWPFWLNPRQVMIITVNDSKEVVDHAFWAKDQIQGGGFHNTSSESPIQTRFGKQEDLDTTGVSRDQLRPRELNKSSFAIDIDDSPRSLKKKISEAKRSKYSVIVVVGKKNIEVGGTITVDFQALPESQNVIRQKLLGLLDEDTRHSQSDRLTERRAIISFDNLKDVEIEPWMLREILLSLERGYH